MADYTVKVRATLACALLAGTLGACGANADTSGSSEKTVHVAALVEQTGTIAFAGKAVQEGMELAVNGINSSKMLGDTKLVLDIKDAASQPATAASLTNKIASSNAVAMLGPVLSNDGLAAAPIAQKKKLPMVAIQTNTKGIVEAGDYVYRITPPFPTLDRLTTRYLASQGVKTAALAYVADLAGPAELARDYFPKWFKADGITLVASLGNPSTATDFSTTISRLVKLNPDAIGLATISTQLPALIKGLRSAGYQGKLFVYAITPDTLRQIGAAANGLLYTLDFSSAMDEASSAKFTKEFKDKTGELPYNYNANGYDAVRFVAEAIKIAKTRDREGVKAAMEKVAAKGFVGAGGQFTFDSTLHRDARLPGVLVEWTGDQERVLLKGKPGLDEQ